MKHIKSNLKIIIGVTCLGFFIFIFFSSFLSPFQDLDYQILSKPSPEDSRFAKEVGDLLDPAFVEGNQVETFLNGDEIFPAMLEGIKSAKHSITFESYIYWSGNIGKVFAEALAGRARAGVKVHVLIDWAGSGKISKELLETMTSAGVEVERYHKPTLLNITRLNYRTHRKILVIDGRTGFTGGVGIADEWTGDGKDPKRWRDTHYKVEGPVVNQMQAAFMDNWLKTKPLVHTGDHYFPKISSKGSMKAQMFISSAGEGGSSVRIMYLMAIESAKKSIHLESAYFVPDEHVIEKLIEAKNRGVDVKIIVPGEADSEVVEQASRELWGKLLKEGVQIFQYQPALFHCKVLIVDRYLVSVGSTNFDQRSFRINDEANLNVLDKAFAETQEEDFENDLKLSKQITYEQWLDRPFKEKALGKLAQIVGSQL